MNKIRCVIVDDVSMDIAHLSQLLQEHEGICDVVASFTNPVEAISFIQKNNITLLFVDIRMRQLNGFEFINQLNRQDIFVVFVTNHEEYALKAFELSALDYLIKPVTPERLSLTLEKIVGGSTQNLRQQIEVLQTALSALMSTSSKPSRLVVNNQQSIEIINIEEILYCVADGPYTTIYLHGGKQIVTTKPLKYYEALLPIQDFFRLHRSYLVNLKEVQIIDKASNSVKLVSGQTIPINADRLNKFIETYKPLAK